MSWWGEKRKKDSPARQESQETASQSEPRKSQPRYVESGVKREVLDISTETVHVTRPRSNETGVVLTDGKNRVGMGNADRAAFLAQWNRKRPVR